MSEAEVRNPYKQREYEVAVPRPDGQPFALGVQTGGSIVIAGANGSGKTRLGAFLDQQESLPGHRIAAHKSLTINDNVTLFAYEKAASLLFYGAEQGQHGHKIGNRWAGRPAVHLLNDFDALLQSLFAERNRIASEHLEQRTREPNIPVPSTKLQRLKTVWDGLLPHRKLQIGEASVRVLLPDGANSEGGYAASEMSDGERAMFYFLGQCLMAREGSIVVVDEPEGHVHKAVLGPLWDAIEKARPDCGFLYITHDLDFAVSRPAAAKYYIRSYTHNPQTWDIADVPKGTGLPEHVVAEIVGSRKPVLFVEGERGSLDVTIYRHQYEGFTIVPIGGCDAVIHSVATYKNSGELHWLEAKGLIDADHRSGGSEASLRAKQVYVLPVAEVENLLLLPDVFMALAEAWELNPAERLTILTEKVLKIATTQTEDVCVRYTARQLDERLKRVAMAAKDLATLDAGVRTELANIDPAMIFNEFKAVFEKALLDRDLEAVLKLFDNKTLLSVAMGVLSFKDDTKMFMGRVERLLGNKKRGQKLRDALTKYLPTIPVPGKSGAAPIAMVQQEPEATAPPPAT
jgi:ABC-type lipoprotein export system ATPase subunit